MKKVSFLDDLTKNLKCLNCGEKFKFEKGSIGFNANIFSYVLSNYLLFVCKDCVPKMSNVIPSLLGHELEHFKRQNKK